MYKDTVIFIHAFPMSFYKLYPYLTNDQIHPAMRLYVEHYFHSTCYTEKQLIDDLLSMIGKVTSVTVSDVAMTTVRVIAALDEKFKCYADDRGMRQTPDIRIMYIPIGDTGFAVIRSSEDLLEKHKFYSALGETLIQPVRPPHGLYQIPHEIVKGDLPFECLDMMLKWTIEGVRDGDIPAGKEDTYAAALLFIGEQLPKLAEEMVTLRQYRWSWVVVDDHTFSLIFESTID